MTPRSALFNPLFSFTTIVGLLAASLTPATAAAAEDETERLTLAGSALPALVADDFGVSLIAAASRQPVDPATTVFTAQAGEETVTRPVIDTAALSDGASLDDLQLTFTVTSSPDQAALTLQVLNGEGARTEWPEDVPLLVQGESSEFVFDFDTPGRYVVSFAAEAAIANGVDSATASGTDNAVAEVHFGTPFALHTDYTFDVAPADVEPQHQSYTGTASQPPSVDEQTAVNLKSGDAETGAPTAAPTVVAAGDIRLTTSLEDGRLAQKLANFTNDAVGADLDLTTTVLAVPNAESWPGGNGEDPDLWNGIAPERGQVWRTGTEISSENDVRLSLDSRQLQVGEIYTAYAAFDGEGGLFTRLGSIDGPASAAWLRDGNLEAGTSLLTGDAAPWVETGPPGEAGIAPSLQAFAAVFTGPGRYCLTLQSNAQLADTGTVLNNDVTLTFAVGDIDASDVVPCAQPEPVPAQPPVPERADVSDVTVIDSGVALLASTLDERALSLDVVTTDRGRTTSFDPSLVIFSLPSRDSRWPAADADASVRELWARYLPEGQLAYRSAGDYRIPGTAAADEHTNGLTLDLEARFIDVDDVPDITGVTYDFVGSTTTSDAGQFFAYRNGGQFVTSADDIGFWDSQSGADSIQQWADSAAEWTTPYYVPTKQRQGGSALGTAFTAPGVYCVTVRTATTLADGSDAQDQATFTFAVGVDAHAVRPCDQASGDPGGDDENPGGEGPGELDPTVAWMQQGHVDLALRESENGGLEFATGDPGTVGMHTLDNAVWVGKGSYASYTVREPNAFDDRRFIGPVGSTYYGFSAGPENASRTLWPGLSMLYLPLDATNRDAAWTLRKVSGPGDVFAWTGGRVFIDSRQGESSEFSLGHTHVHENWAFTEAGVYCLAVSARLRAADDESVDRTGSSLLTVVVGDVDLSTVQPCARTHTVPEEPAAPGVSAAPDRVVVDGDSFGRGLELTHVDGGVDVVSSLVPKLGDPTTYLDPERVVYSTRQAGDRAVLDAWDWRTLPYDIGGSDVTLTLGDVSGPGGYYMTGNRLDRLSTQLDTRSAPAKTAERLWPGYMFPSAHTFTAVGVYCVPFTWAGTLRDGTAFKTTKTLTFAVGVNPSGVELCADGGEGTDPGGGTDPGEQPSDSDVPNGSLTDSGATIIAAGHIDIASVLDHGDLDTKIKDSATAATPVLREPAETVLQVRPEAQTRVPASGYEFLGEVGAPIWQVAETEQEGLLWPGWSTESIPVPATTAGVTWTLTDSSGPGEVILYQTPFTGPQILFNTRDGITSADAFEIAKNTHAHGSWAFSAEGTYCLAFQRAATLADGAGVVDDFTLVFAVGQTDVTRTDPAKCFAEPEGQPTDPDRTPVPMEDLTDANAGGVQILGGENGFAAGQLATVQVGTPKSGKWVSVWFDDALWLGWLEVGGSGAIQVRLPSDRSVGSHALVVKDRDGGLVGWDSLSIVPAEDPGGGGDNPGGPGEEPEPEPDSVWDVANGTVNETGAVVLNNGHVDIASLVEGRSLPTRVKDTTASGTPVWHEPEDTVLQLLPSSRATIPAGEQWSFLGQAGASFYQVTQRQQAGLLWPGWSTESIPLSATEAGVDWRLTDITGPGEFALYETGAFGEPSILFNTRDGITAADALTIPKNTHAHGSWAFSAQGNYCLAFERSATLASGTDVSDEFVLAIAVGRADVMRVDPGACFTEPDDRPSDVDRTPIPEDEMTDAAAGPVRVLDKTDGFTPGQLVSVQVGAGHADAWVSVWLHSDPEWLGWAKTDADGIAQVRLPADAAEGGHKLVVKDREGALIGWDGLRVIDPEDPDGGDGGDGGPGEEPIPDAVWDVRNGTVNERGATVLNNGHVDIASVLRGGRLDTQVKDTTAGEAVWREVDKTVLQLLPSSRTKVPSSSAYGFLGAPGSTLYQVTQLQQDNLLWPGWSTESIALDATTGGVAWRLTDMSGPGEFALYESDSFGNPSVLFSTRDGITAGDRFTIPKNTHAHGSWAFTAQGNYCLAMQRTAQLPSGQTVSDAFVLAVAVGTADVMRMDPAACGEQVDTDPGDDTPPPSGNGQNDTSASQQVAATQCVAGATVLSSGHVDFASRIVGGKLESLVGDDTSGTKVYREPDGTILWLKPSSKVSLPAGFGPVGPAGSSVWQVPQTQNLDLIWLGWNTESLNAGNTRGPVQWTINGIDGPGSVKVYLTGSFGGIQQMVFNNGGSYSIPLGVHAHANWAFSAEGVYRITMTQTATLANGQTSSDTETLTIVVGNVDPATAAGSGSGCGTVSNALLLSDDTEGALAAADQAAADAAAAARDRLPGEGTPEAGGFTDPFSALAQGDPVPLLLSILGVLLLAGSAGAGVLWWRRRRDGLSA